ncbi:FkbM family methyltransferase [Sphingobium sp. B1D7B]|uniref:FkbM family methyltransferase n=1 Tax=Sphingobium sp. B1D7B TaxID=2940578 RepID=UPI002224C25B|nr:FkbM family methyltransferase [Sphingobium sp. B1D7B]MCW2405013.1 FkbM family methyltransferase [Sphingobium sp. B1D7B]
MAAREAIDGQVIMLRRPEMAAVHVSCVLMKRLRDRLCPPGGVFVDIGAHIGSVIAAVQRYSAPSQIIAFEAIPEKVERLRAKFPGVEIHQCALGERAGEVEFTIDLVETGNSSLNTAVQGRSAAHKVISVEMQTLDHLMGGHRVDLMKIDVEGAELGVLRGGETTIADQRPLIVFESGAEEMEGYPRRDLFDWFQARDYDLVTPSRLAHTAPPATWEVFADAHQYPFITWDWFAVPREKRSEVRRCAARIMSNGARQ